MKSLRAIGGIPRIILALSLLTAIPAPAAIAVRGTPTTASVTTGTTLTITKPTAVVAGDVMMASIAQYATSSAAASASGWTAIKSGSLSSTSRFGTVLYKIAGASEGSSYTFTLSPSVSGAVGDIVAFSGVDNTTPLDATGSGFATASSTAVGGTAITTTTNNAAAILFGMAASTSSGTGGTWGGWASGLTELYDNQGTGTGNNATSVGAAWKSIATAGTTGAGSATLSASMRNGGYWIALRAAVNPASAANSTTTASPASVYADNYSTSTVTVTLKDSLSAALQGKTVTLTSSRGATDTISAASGTSDASGVVTFTVKSATTGAAVLTATDTTDAVVVTQTPTVTFTTPPLVSMANSTVIAAPNTVPSDGISITTVTVTLKDATSAAVAGKTVTLVSSRGATDTITTASSTSNTLGVVTFTVKSSTAGSSVFTATDTSDSVTLTQSATTTFTTAWVDISNTTTPWEPANTGAGVRIDTAVGTGNIGRLIGLTQTHWSSGGFTVPIQLNGNTLKIDSGNGNAMNVSGSISGPGALVFQAGGSSPMHVKGNSGNAYSGTTTISNAIVSLEKTSGDALAGPITLTASTSNLTWTAGNQINDASDITLSAASATLNLAGYSDTVNNLYLITGTVVQTGAGGVLKVAKLFINGIQQPNVAYAADGVYVTGSGYIDVGNSGPPVIVSPPATPSTPSPADGVTTIHPATFTKLDWADSTGAASYDVYMWKPATEAKPATPTANVLLSEYTPTSSLLSLTNYHWQVVAKNSAGNTAGPEWSFTTVDRTLVPGNYGVPYSDATHNLNYIVGIGNSATLLGDFWVHWSGASGSFSVPVNTNGFTLHGDTGGGNSGHVASGPISGTGSFVINHGPHNSNAWNNPYTISGATNNTYTGGTTVTRGLVYLNKTPGIDALPGTGTITLGSVGETARLLWGNNNQINNNATITLLLPTVTNGYAPDANLNYLDLAGFSDTVGTLNLPDAGTKTQVRTGTGGVLTTAVLTINGKVMAAGTYTAANYDFVTGTGSVVVTTGGGPAFDTWVGATGKGLTGSAAAFNADPDHDGIPNGIEFVLGSEPNPANANAASPALPTAHKSGNNLVFTFTRRHEAAYLNPSVEFSNNPGGPWTTATDPTTATIAVTPGSLADTVDVTIPQGSNTKLFARLKVGINAVAGQVPPRVTTSPLDTTLVGGADFTLTAAAGGAHDVTWQWYLNGQAIAGATSSSYSVTGATSANQGDYQVVASNASGNDYSAVAHVIVSTTPGYAGLNLIPWPLNVTPASGTLTIPTSAHIVVTDPTLLDAANVLAGEMTAAFARTLPVITTAATDGDIVLALDNTLAGERHTLTVTTRATVGGHDAFAVSLGTATLVQALRLTSGALVCPHCTIDDTPAVGIRTLSLDLARHDHSLESLFQAVDLCHLYKINYLHLHFNDDQAYTFPSTAYPLLNSVTTSRGRLVYSLADMQNLEAYAVARGVHIMPELEGPGHNALMLAAYPSLFQITYPYDPNSTDPNYPKYQPSSSINVARADVRAAVRTLIGEMCAVFQSTPYMHIGCDEVDWAWSQYNTDFQAAFTLWGFNRSDPTANVGLVFSKFITIERGYAAEFGKQSIVWENSAMYGSPEVPASTDILIEPFDCYNPGSFVTAGYNLVNAAWSPLYLVNDIRKPVSSIYAWDRTIFGQYSGEDIAYISHIVSAQNVTGTQLTTFEQIEDMEVLSARRRLAAMSERTWNPGLLGATFDNFSSRVAKTDSLLDSILSPVCVSYEGLDNPDDRVFSSNAIITLSLAPGYANQSLTIRYTTDLTNPTTSSTLYTGPFQVSDNGYLRAAAFNASGQRVGYIARELYRHEMTVTGNLAAGNPVTVSTGTNAAYAVDVLASTGWTTNVSTDRPAGETLTVDLQSIQTVDRIALLFDPSGTYYYQLAISSDGTNWTTVADMSTTGVAGTRAGITHTFTTAQARYVKLTLLPHTDGTGDKTVREIMVTGNNTTYTGFDDPTAQKTTWVGRNVAFLTESSSLDPVVMDKITTTFDAVFDYYANATGQLPAPYLTYQGRSLVAEVDVSCGAGCGILGATGVELAAGYFGVLYDAVRTANQYDQVLFYEFGRNFYFYDGKIRYKETGPMAAPTGSSGWIGTGYAVLMRFASMDATGVNGAPYGGAPFANFRASVEGMVDTYVATPSLNFQNTMLINTPPPGGGTTDFFASLCLRLAKWYGPQVLSRMWLEIGSRADATTTQDAVDNWFLGCCYGSGRNLTNLFTTTWKIPLSTAAQSEAQTRWGAPLTTFP